MNNDTFQGLDQVLRGAIEEEKKVCRLYLQWKDRVVSLSVRSFMAFCSESELAHLRLLEKSDQGTVPDFCREKGTATQNYCDPLGEVDLNEKIDLQGAVIFAMKEERRSIAFYRQLAMTHSASPLWNLFAFMEQDEQRHLAALEQGYEELFLQWM